VSLKVSRTGSASAWASWVRLVAEYRELEEVAERLGIKADAETVPATTSQAQGARRRARAGAGRKPTAPTRKRASRTTGASHRAHARSPRSGRTPASNATRQADTRVNGGQRQQQVLELVKQRPGITVREVGQQLGVDPTSLYRVVRKLEQESKVKKQGPELQPA
jgi:DNA-binding NtrC family response regulator